MKILKVVFLIAMFLFAGAFIYAQGDAPEPSFNWWSLVQIGLGALITFFGSAWAWIKRRAGKLTKAGKEVYDVFKAIEDALADDKLDKSEAQNILAEGKEALGALKELIGKEAA